MDSLTAFHAARFCRPIRLALVMVLLLAGAPCALAQVDYSVHFEMVKPRYLLGEPIFCRFVIRNTGSKVFAFRYRTPTRALAADYEQEPRFRVTGMGGQLLPDPGPRPCGSPQGTNVYGSVTLPPGREHAELWLLNQWARFSAPGHYRVHAERRMALLEPGPGVGSFSDKPAAFALAIDDLEFQVVRSTPAQVEAAFQPYLDALQDPRNDNPSEAVVVLTSLPQPFFLTQLITMADTPRPTRWNRRDVLDGLARLDTPASWQEILKIFRGEKGTNAGGKESSEQADNLVRSYALLLLAEKGEPAFIPAFTAMLAKGSEPMRGDILRSLGFFHDPRAYQPLFDNLHSAQATDRMNAILGLKNLGTKEVIPALLAALNDPEAQVRDVANFALVGLTGHKVTLSDDPSRAESERAAADWHAWWLKHGDTFAPPRPAPCHDW